MESFMSEFGGRKRNGVVLEVVGSGLTYGVKCFKGSNRWFDRLTRGMAAVHEGFWLGCLSVGELNDVTTDYYAKSQYYPSIEHNLGGFFKWEKPTLDRFFRPGSRILVAAAGAGREVLALRQAGYEAEGFECNASLVAASHEIFDEQGEPNYVALSLPDSVPLGGSVYDGLFVGWSGYAHIPTKSRRVAFLQALRRRGLPRSPLLISFFLRHGGSPDKLITSNVAGVVRFLLRRRKEPLEAGDSLRVSGYSHAFTRNEIQAELSAAGFRLAHYSEDGDAGHAVGISE